MQSINSNKKRKPTFLKIMALSAAFLVIVTTIFADANKKGKEGRGSFLKTEVLEKLLDLNTNQLLQIKKINDKYSHSFASLSEKIKNSRAELRPMLFSDVLDIQQIRLQLEKISAQRIEHQITAIQRRGEIEWVLTTAQKIKLREMIQNRKR